VKFSLWKDIDVVQGKSYVCQEVASSYSWFKMPDSLPAKCSIT